MDILCVGQNKNENITTLFNFLQKKVSYLILQLCNACLEFFTKTVISYINVMFLKVCIYSL